MNSCGSRARSLADEPQPGLVEVQLTDTDGRTWRFTDKASIFTSEPLDASSIYPRRGAMRCAVLRRETAADGSRVAIIDTFTPDGLSSQGQSEFCVPDDAVQAIS